MTVDHEQRAHAKWSASASARNAVCAGAIAMCSMVDGRESEAAAFGTVCHEIAEQCLRNQALSPEMFEGQTRTVGRFAIDIDDEMSRVANAYLEYCGKRIEAEEQVLFWIEESLPLDKIHPPIEAGGTGDLVIYFRRLRLLTIIDLKTGRKVFVDAKGSWQMRTYALGALLAHEDLDVENVEAVIVQPRLEHGDDGGIRSETFHIADLYEWTADMLAAMQRSADAEREFAAIQGNRVKFDEWAEKWLATGQCTFCDARGVCPKFRSEALAPIPQKARKWFETPSDEAPPALSNAAMLLSLDELAHALNGLEAIEGWARAVREKAHNDAERGATIPGWILVQKIGNRAWIDEAKATATLGTVGIAPDKQYTKKLITPAQADKLLGKRKTEIADLWHKPVRGLNLVRADKTDRPAVAGKAVQHFEVPDET